MAGLVTGHFVSNKVVSELNKIQKGRIDQNFQEQQKSIVALTANQAKIIEKIEGKEMEGDNFEEVPEAKIQQVERGPSSVKPGVIGSERQPAAAYVLRVPARQEMKNCTHNSQSLRCVKYHGTHKEAGFFIVDISGTHPFSGEKRNVMLDKVKLPDMKSKDQCERIKAEKLKKEVAGLLGKAKRVDLENVRRGTEFGTDFRIVADVAFDGRSLADTLVRKGLARKSGSRMGWCE